jgi:hypothetical protein
LPALSLSKGTRVEKLTPHLHFLLSLNLRVSAVNLPLLVPARPG